MTHELRDPAELRPLVVERQGGYCLRCHEPFAGSMELHHRVKRRVLGWCACNIVGLHPRCHTMGPRAVHDHPEEARGLGLIVASFGTPTPARVPVVISWPWEGEALLSCDGSVTSLDLTTGVRARTLGA